MAPTTPAPTTPATHRTRADNVILHRGHVAIYEQLLKREPEGAVGAVEEHTLGGLRKVQETPGHKGKVRGWCQAAGQYYRPRSVTWRDNGAPAARRAVDENDRTG
jgi:hypothetical protein